MKALAKLFAGKFLGAARRVLPAGTHIPNITVGTRWNVFVKPAMQGGDAVLRYLGRYVHKTAIADGAILACEDNAVRFRYRHSSTHQRKTMALPPHEFLRRFLQHVLPQGLHRVRAYGLFSSAHRITLQRLRLLLRAPDVDADDNDRAAAEPKWKCPNCDGGSLILTRRLSPDECIAMLASLAAPARAPPALAQIGAVS